MPGLCWERPIRVEPAATDGDRISNEASRISRRSSALSLAVGLGALALLVALGGAHGRFLPPWSVRHGALGGVWPPLLAAFWWLALLLAARGALGLSWGRIAPLMPTRIRDWIDPTRRDAATPTRLLDSWDWVLIAALVAGEYALVETYRGFYNPESRCIGHDNYAFLSTAVAAGSGRWDLYMVDKRPLFGIITAVVAKGMDDNYIRAAVAVNMVLIALMQAPTYIIGRLFGGRWVGLSAGIMLLGVSLLYPFGHETASYPLYSLATTAAVAAVAWALIRPGTRTFLVAGLIMAVVTFAQVKNFTFNLPMAALLGLSIMMDGQGKRWLRAGLVAGPIAGVLAILTAYPVDFTPLNVLIMHHREEVHYEIPYTRAHIDKPDPAFPSPISRYLPDALRWGEVEALATVILAPPDSDVMAAFPGDGPGRRWAHCPGTSIPPWSERVGHNLQQADELAPGVGSILFPLAGLGWMFALLGLGVRHPTRGERFRWRTALPSSWWHVGVLLVPLASCFGSLSLKFNFRYVFHFVPTTLVMVAIGCLGLSRILIGHRGRLWQLAHTIVGMGICAGMAVALFIRAPLLGVGLDANVVKKAFFRLPPDHRQLMGKGMDLVSQFVTNDVPKDARVFDCTPIALGLFIPEDRRLIRPKNGSERDKLCKAQLSTEPGERPRVLVVTSIPEFFGPDAVTPAKVGAVEGWTLVYGYDIHDPRELLSDDDLARMGPGWLAVFTDSPERIAAASQLDGEPAGIWVLEPGSPALPRGTVGAPKAGNP
jgi:hypothetical protein